MIVFILNKVGSIYSRNLNFENILRSFFFFSYLVNYNVF